ncbi:MAG: DUF1565 domain-containing protein [Candidatus Margulisiibacteriota bacterium]
MALAADFVVTSEADSGAGSLREAIELANSTAGPDTITFEADFNLVLSSALPDITEEVIIDAGTKVVTLEGGGSRTYGLVIGADDCVVTADGSVKGLRITGFTTVGILLNNVDRATISNCRIYGNSNWGIKANGAHTGHIIRGCYLGTNDGLSADANGGNGIDLAGTNHYVGGPNASDRNIIAGNTGNGINLSASGCTIEGNYIGLQAGGNAGLGNGGNGICLDNSSNSVDNRIIANRIGANVNHGISINSGSGGGNIIQGNYIGVGADGSTDQGNTKSGIYLDVGISYEVIGGTLESERNVISGNGNQGITIFGPYNQVVGNFIGTTAEGMAALPNDFGIATVNAYHCTIEANLISGNTNFGLRILDGTQANRIVRNRIGTNRTGSAFLPNLIGLHALTGGSAISGNEVGGPTTDEANVIAGNTTAGLVLDGASVYGNKISKNSFYGNNSSAPQGIVLGSGANHGIPVPVIGLATKETAGAVATYLSGTATPDAVIEVFLAPTGSNNSSAEGKTFLGTTESNGSGSWALALTGLSIGTTLCVTATNNLNDTSQFSSGRLVALAPSDLYVALTGSDTTGTGSVGSPFRTVTKALSQITAGYAVHVAAGTYNSAGGEAIPLTVPASTRLLGAGRGLTTLEGTPVGTTIDHLVKLEANSTLEGFAVRASSAGVGFHRTVVYLAGYGSALLSSEVIDNGSSRGSVYVGYGQVLVRGNIVRLASTSYGILVSNFLTGASVDGVMISHNGIRDNLIGITLAGVGAGHSLTINNNTFVNNGNGAGGYGILSSDGGLGNYQGIAHCYNNIIYSSGSNANGIRLGSAAGTLEVRYSDLYGLATNYSLVTPGAGTLEVNPQFVNDSNDLRIYDSSDCTAGTPEGTVMGAYGIYSPSPPALVSSVSPNTGTGGQTGLQVRVNCLYTHFDATTTADFGAGVTVTNLTVEGKSRLVAVLSIATGAVAGSRNVTLNTVSSSEIVTGVGSFGVTAAPGDRYVSSLNGSDSNTGLSFGSAFKTIKKALTQVGTGNTILVGTGEYTAVDEIFPIVIPAGVTLEGVGKGYVTIEAAISGMFGSAVTLANGAAIKGCTLFVTGNGGNKNYLGIYVSGADNCRISEMTIYGNERFANFGGPEINAGIIAGGIGGPGAANNLLVSTCEVRDLGSAVVFAEETGTTASLLNKNTIVGCLNGLLAVNSCTNTYNITNTIIASCENSGVMQDCGTINFFYNNTWEAAPAISGGTFNAGAGNISVDPLFVNKAAKDFHLSWANYPTVDGTKSPCIDSGTPALTDMGAYDFIPPSAGPINPPTAFSGSAESTFSIRWSWQHDTTNLLGFRLLNESGATLAIINPATSVSTVEDGLTANTRYQRIARAYNNTSSADATAARYTWADVPTALAIASRASTEVTLSWLGNGTRYQVERSFDGTNFTFLTTTITATSFADSRLLPNKRYWYRVSAFNGDGIMTAPSLTVLATTGAYTAGPIIRYATATRRQIREGDVVSSRPLIGAIVESTIGFDRDGVFNATFTRISDGTRYGPYSVSTYSRYEEGTDLYAIGWNHGLMSTMEAGEYWLDLSVTDTLGNTGTLRVKVKIYSATGGTILIPGTEPTADKPSFDPIVGESATILYSLTTPANVQIIGYGPTAKMAFNLHFAADTNGGLAGTNSEAKWDGREPSGAIAGKGIYVYRIIANGKAIGKGYLVVK